MSSRDLLFNPFQLYDSAGSRLTSPVPKVLSADWCRTVYYKGDARVGAYDAAGRATSSPIREELVRAQVPYIVTLLTYRSKFEVIPNRREYFLYAPQELTKAAAFAFSLWRRWEKQRPIMEFNFTDLEDDYPKVDDGAVAEPIGDSDFDQHWNCVKKYKHKAAGDPERPFAFTSLESDVMMYRAVDFQRGLNHKIR